MISKIFLHHNKAPVVQKAHLKLWEVLHIDKVKRRERVIDRLSSSWKALKLQHKRQVVLFCSQIKFYIFCLFSHCWLVSITENKNKWKRMYILILLSYENITCSCSFKGCSSDWTMAYSLMWNAGADNHGVNTPIEKFSQCGTSVSEH